MTQNLTPEQVNYLKSLDSKKKRRKFMLDCLVESAIGESEKFNEDTLIGVQKINTIYTNTTAPKTISESLKNRQEFGTENFDFMKAHVEAVDRIIPKDELLKFDMLEDRKRNYPISEIIDFVVDESLKKIDESANSEKKYTEEDMIRAFEKGNHATCNAFTLRDVPSDSQIKLYTDLKEEFKKSLKND